MSRTIKLRDPDLILIFYELIVCILAPLLFLPFVLLDPRMVPSQNPSEWVWVYGFAVVLLFLLVSLPSLLILFMYWKEFIFDGNKRLFIIKRYIFFFPIGKQPGTPFENISLQMKHQFMTSSTFQGVGGGFVWSLMVVTFKRKEHMTYSIFRGRIERKMKKIQELLK